MTISVFKNSSLKKTLLKEAINLESGWYALIEGKTTVATDGKMSVVFWNTVFDRDHQIKPADTLLRFIKREGFLKGAEQFCMKYGGNYCFIACKGDGILAYRSLTCSKPLYYSVQNKTVIITSKRTPFLLDGIRNFRRIGNGKLVIPGAKSKKVYYSPSIKDVDIYEAIITAPMRLGLTGKIAVAFSGGVDSCITAKAIADVGGEVKLFTTVFEGGVDEECALEAAEALDLPLKVTKVEDALVEERLEKIILAAETSDVIQVSVSIPVYFTCLEASKEGFSVLSSGQGADELTAGYHRYERALIKYGYDRIRMMLKSDISEFFKGVEFFDRVSSALGVSSIPLFTDQIVFEVLNSITPRDKIRVIDNKVVRKIVLRNVATKMGIPEKIALRDKKAAQYSSGCWKTLKRIAKMRLMKLRREVGAERYLRTMINSIATKYGLFSLNSNLNKVD